MGMSDFLPWDRQMMFCFDDVSMCSEELFTHAIGKHLMIECAERSNLETIFGRLTW